MRRLLAALAFICIGSDSIGAAAPDGTATIRVRVVSATPVAGSTIVELVSAASPLRWTLGVRDQNDAAIFHHVPPGSYRLTVRQPGFRETAADVDVRAATMLEFVVDFRRTTQPGGEPLLQLVRTDPVGDVRAFDQSMLGTFPGDDALASVVETAVAPLIVDRMSSGGLWLAESALVGGYGGSWRQTSITLGAIDVTDPVRTGTPLVRAPQEAIASLLVSTTLLPASAGGPGPVLTMVPKSPAGGWHGASEIGVVPQALQDTNTRPGVPSVARLVTHRDWNAQLGAPLGPRAGLFLTVRRIATGRVESDDPTRLRTSVKSLFASSSVDAGSQGRLRLAASVDRTASPYAGRARFRDRSVRESDTFTTAQASWDRWTAGGTAWSVASGVAQGTLSPALDAVRTSGPLDMAGTVERLIDGSVPTLFDVAAGTRRRWTAGADITPALGRVTRRHLLSGGATLAYSTAVARAGPSPPAAEMVNGIPARVWEFAYGGPQTRWTSTDVAAYASDRVLLGDRGRVDAGVRMESTGGSAQGGSSMSWRSAAPRLTGRWLLETRGRVALFGGYARYLHRLPLDDFAYGDPSALSGRVYRWNDVNADRVLQEGERGTLVALVGPCCASSGPNRIDPNLERPHTDEFAGGVDARVGSWSVRVMGVHRHEHHLIGSLNTGVTTSDYVLRYVLDPGEPFRDPVEERLLSVYDREPFSFGRDQYVLTNPPGHEASYHGVDVTVEGRIASRLRTRFEGSAYHSFALGGNRGFRPLENDPGVIGELFENPNAATYARGHAFFDRGYVMKWWASVRAPGDYLLSAVARYQDGQPFGRLSVVPDLNQGAEAIYGYRPGRTRFTFTLTVDAHLEKALTIGRTRVAGILEVFNLLNSDKEVEEHVVTGAAFRSPTAVQPPRAARVGLRISF
ncbi:MAG: carboxypeptidase regulatory-like domain-containing protein [Acidobacteria bacterium]|nr:carboxypeptidase regulatory-like domain-containing protein [Acidobacteriota bacterium]